MLFQFLKLHFIKYGTKTELGSLLLILLVFHFMKLTKSIPLHECCLAALLLSNIDSNDSVLRDILYCLICRVIIDSVISLRYSYTLQV
jgi:hypothetical protein